MKQYRTQSNETVIDTQSNETIIEHNRMKQSNETLIEQSNEPAIETV